MGRDSGGIQMSEKETKWINCYTKHLNEYLGPSIARTTFQQNSVAPPLQVLTYDQVFSDCRVFCSLGLTHYIQEVQNTTEVILVTDDGWNDIPYILANALFYIVQTRMKIGWGMVVGGVEVIAPSFASEFGKTALYFTNPNSFPEKFGHISCQPEKGKLFQTFFISPEERKFFRQYGAYKFEEMLEEKSVDPFDLKRPSCV